MLVPKNDKGNMWIFFKPLSRNLWITTAAFFILTGIVVWVVEHPTNTEFQGTPGKQIGTVLWFSFSTLVFAYSKCYISVLPIIQVLLSSECSTSYIHILRSYFKVDS
jgi:ionotropic glutamate receptor